MIEFARSRRGGATIGAPTGVRMLPGTVRGAPRPSTFASSTIGHFWSCRTSTNERRAGGFHETAPDARAFGAHYVALLSHAWRVRDDPVVLGGTSGLELDAQLTLGKVEPVVLAGDLRLAPARGTGTPVVGAPLARPRRARIGHLRRHRAARGTRRRRPAADLPRAPRHRPACARGCAARRCRRAVVRAKRTRSWTRCESPRGRRRVHRILPHRWWGVSPSFLVKGRTDRQDVVQHDAPSRRVPQLRDRRPTRCDRSRFERRIAQSSR